MIRFFWQKMLLFSVLGLMVVSQVAVAENVDDVIKKVQKKYRSAKNIHIEFTEKVRFSLTGTEVEVPAVLQMEGQDKFRLESEDQLVVNNGETFWRFNKLDSQVLVDYAKKSDQDVMLNTFLNDFRDQYYAQLLEEMKIEGVNHYVIRLTPKPNENSIFTSVKIWVKDKDWEIDRLIYEDYNTNETEYVISKTNFDPKFQETLFSFNPPEGIEVIDLRL